MTAPCLAASHFMTAIREGVGNVRVPSHLVERDAGAPQ